jgi:outer membrane lipoprotein
MDMNKLRLYLTPLGLIFVFILTGCATNIPSAVQQAPAQVLSVSQVRQDTERYMGRDIRWGGEIIFLENGSDSTDMAVLATTLGSKGKPDADGALDARFLARVPAFLDPAEFAEGRRVTVTGVITGVESRLVGEYAYSYPLVQVQVYYLWPKEKPRINNYYYNDPFYDPWRRYGPWGRYPYWW